MLPDATEGVLEFPDQEETYEFTIGDVRPAASIRGVQARMVNLGFFAGPVDGEETPDFKASVLFYQRVRELPETGRIDGATIAKLKEEHGS